MDFSDIYKKLAQFGSELLYKKSLEDGLPFITKTAKEIIGADRCSIFIYDEEAGELWTTFADGVDKIIIPSDKGIVGETLQLKKTVVVNNTNKDPNFFAQIDKQTGYRTYNIIATPIYDATKNVIGVLELLNKDGGFNQQDKKIIPLFSHYISGFIELIVIDRHNLFKK
jgi:GAF domain-containing protein